MSAFGIRLIKWYVVKSKKTLSTPMESQATAIAVTNMYPEIV